MFIPPMLRGLVDGRQRIETAAGALGDVIASLEGRYPLLVAALIEEGQLAPSIAVSINSELVVEGLLELVPAGAEVHFIPAMSGGCA